MQECRVWQERFSHTLYYAMSRPFRYPDYSEQASPKAGVNRGPKTVQRHPIASNLHEGAFRQNLPF
jgi:hypothetical protein